jgi:two-component system, chemotaxis family, response regulator PixG
METPMTTCQQVFTTDQLAQQIFDCAREQLTGRLDVEDLQGKQWTLYFSYGSISGGSGMHPIRSWNRQLSRHCPHLIAELVDRQSDRAPSFDYDFLAEWVKQGKIQREQMVEMVENQVIEILFDIIQHRELLSKDREWQMTYKSVAEYAKSTSLVMMQAEDMWQQANKYWETWQEAELADFSPNLAPVVLHAQELQQQTSELVYNNLTALGDGKWTLRDLAVKFNRSLLLLTKPLLPYLRDGLIELIEVKDLKSIQQPSTRDVTNNVPISLVSAVTDSVNPSPAPRTDYLVACIDDSKVDTQILNHILTQAGYRFINIENHEKAIPTLILQKPDLIFLDLVMPIVNGYEICAQIRRIPFFKYTPVVIVTGKNGITDWARAKMVGSSDFITKPIDREKLVRVLQTYLPIANPV